MGVVRKELCQVVFNLLGEDAGTTTLARSLGVTRDK